MIVEFQVSNFLSIRDKQTLSLLRNSAKELEANYFNPHAPNTGDLLKTAVIYGENGSGKTNLLQALEFMVNLVAGKDLKLNQQHKFRFNQKYANEPTTFFISMVIPMPNEQGVVSNVRFEYGFEILNNIITEEWLSVYPKAREQQWFSRSYDPATQEHAWYFSSHFKGEKQAWVNQTHNTELFLTVATREQSKQMQYVANAINSIIIRTEKSSYRDRDTQELLQANHRAKPALITMLNALGVYVTDVTFATDEQSSSEISSAVVDAIDANEEASLNEQSREHREYPVPVFPVPVLHYATQDGTVQVKFEEESEGTQKLLTLASLLVKVLASGGVLVLDDLNNNLHSTVVKYVVQLFNSTLNKHHAQLICTTYETYLLRKEVLRRDQVYFCHKNRDGATILYPLTLYRPHVSRENIEDGYLSGRYGAIPIMNDLPVDIFAWDECADGNEQE